MFEFLRIHQTNIMLSLSSICVIVALFTSITKTLPKRRKLALILMQLSAAIWLEGDRLAYIYDGNPSPEAFWPVRIGNFCAYLMIIIVMMAVTQYIEDVVNADGKKKGVKIALRVADLLALAAIILVLISQFTGLYYTIDSNNSYQRTDYFFIGYIFPYLIIFIQFFTILFCIGEVGGIIVFSLFLFDAVSIFASIIQFFVYGISFTDITSVAMVIVLYIFALIDFNDRMDKAQKAELEHLKTEKDISRKLFGQTANVLASIIDSTDKNSKEYAERVAEYSKEIALLSGMDEKTSEEIYFAGLLHDVGRINMDEDLAEKDKDFTDEEKEILKEHSISGSKILASIEGFPALETGAKYHHERYDGKGYPEGLKGKEIPEVARIIAVADAYTDMTSNKSYRGPLPQGTVREEFIKEAGLRFDPDFAEIMVKIIDLDTQYLKKEKEEDDESLKESADITNLSELHFKEYKEIVSDGIRIASNIIKIHFETFADQGFDEKTSIPSLVLFDSADGCVHTNDRSIRILNYLEYCEVWLDGHTTQTAARKIKKEKSELKEDSAQTSNAYDLEAVRYRDHIRMRITNAGNETQLIIALPDAVRYSYLGITGEHCTIKNISVEDTGIEIDENYIPRLVEEISYINHMEGDIPNVQVDTHRAAYTEPVPVSNGMRIVFHSKSLPTANLVWHCPYVCLFASDDGKVNGANYNELVCVRLDGESMSPITDKTNEIYVKRDEMFEGWDSWKEFNKKGFESEILFKRRRNRIIINTENDGISIKNTTYIAKGVENVYAVLTGDQCALTDIRIIK